MRISAIAALSFAVLTSACQTAQQTVEDDPPTWARFDCQRISSHPQLEADFERAKLICIGRADAAAIAGTANMRPGYGIGGTIAAGIAQGTAQTQISLATGISCMAELGYHRLNHRSEFEALCPLPAAKAKKT